jgi:hypothetical protein
MTFYIVQRMNGGTRDPKDLFFQHYETTSLQKIGRMFIRGMKDNANDHASESKADLMSSLSFDGNRSRCSGPMSCGETSAFTRAVNY